MMYNTSVEAMGSGTFLFPRNCNSQSSIVGKVPSMCGLTSRPSPRQRPAAHRGHFAMTIFTLYQYTNRTNGKRYIGVTNDPARREQRHAAGTSKARAFNAAMKKYGRDAFDFRILAVFDDVNAASYHEQAAIGQFKSLSPDGYNLRAGAPYTRYSGPMSAETRARMSAANKGKRPSDKTLAAAHSPQSRAKMSAAQKGRKQTAEQVRKNSESHKGLQPWMKGKHHTEEAKRKNSEAHKGKSHPHTPESRAKLRAARMKQPHPFLGKVPSEEHRAKISAALKGHKVSAETRAKISAAKRKTIQKEGD